MDYLISRINTFSLNTYGLTRDNFLEQVKKDFVHIPSSEKLIICLPGWRQELWTWKNVKNLTATENASFLTYEFPGSILSNNLVLTQDVFEEINNLVRNDIESLKNEFSFKEIVLLTVSLASSFGSMIYKNNANISQIILVAPGENLARDMWYGCRTPHLRKSYQTQGLNLEKLEKEWLGLASENNLPHKDTEISIFYGKNDKVIPFNLSFKLSQVISAKFNSELKILNLGHYFLIFYFLLFPNRFLKFR